MYLWQCLLDNLLMQMAKKKTGKEVWDYLKARFVGADRVKEARLQTLKAEFSALKMKEEESLYQYAEKLTVMSVTPRWLRSCLTWCRDGSSLWWPASSSVST